MSSTTQPSSSRNAWRALHSSGVPETSVVRVCAVSMRGQVIAAGRGRGAADAVTSAPTSGGFTISPAPISALQSPK